MRPETFERVDVMSEADVLPFRAHLSAARAPNLLHLTLLTALAVAIVAPQLGLAGYALMTPDIRNIILDQPAVSLQLAVAMMFWIGLFAWPLRALFSRLTSHRTINITPETVAVADQLAFGASTWSAPLDSYKGVAHHIRSSLSGTRHELVLIHPDADRSVLLLVADRISDADVSRMTQLLRLPQIPASELYRLGKSPNGPTNPLLWNAVPA